MLAQVASPEALRELPEQDEGLQERLNAWIGEAQAGCALAAGCHRALDGSQCVLAEDAVMAQALDFEHSPIGRKPDLPQLGQIVQALANPEVVGVVDGCLGAQGPVFLVVLLDARVLVIDVQGWGHAMGDHPGAEPPLPTARYSAIEDQLHLLGAAEIEVLADHLLEE